MTITEIQALRELVRAAMASMTLQQRGEFIESISYPLPPALWRWPTYREWLAATSTLHRIPHYEDAFNAGREIAPMGGES